MKLKYLVSTLLLTFLFCQAGLAQISNSALTIKSSKDKYVLSGKVRNKFVKESAVEIAKKLLTNVEIGDFEIEENIWNFSGGWETEFAEMISKSKNANNLFIQFSTDQESLPNLPNELASKEILLTNKKAKTNLNSLGDKITILSFTEVWASPAVKNLLFLNDFYSREIAENVNIIAVSSEKGIDERRSFRKFVRLKKLGFQTGWVNKEFSQKFIEIAEIPVIPANFVIKDGKIHGIFVGNAPEVNQRMTALVVDLLNE